MTHSDSDSGANSERLPGASFLGEKSLDEDRVSVLVAEDNVVNQKIAVLLLEKLGLKAHVVSNGREAVQAVMSRDYPVVLMDCHMPEMDGFEATREIRRHELSSGRHTPIIAVTALAMVGDRERCIEAGMDDYIPKPIDKERLRNKLSHWLKNEFAFQNQKLAQKYFQANPYVYGSEPIDIAELEVFYGSTEEVEEVVTLFVNTAHSALEDLDTALQEHRTNTSARIAHELKGASASVGAKEMSILCLQLEQQIGQHDWTAAKKSFQNLYTCFDHVRAFVAQTFASDAGDRMQC